MALLVDEKVHRRGDLWATCYCDSWRESGNSTVVHYKFSNSLKLTSGYFGYFFDVLIYVDGTYVGCTAWDRGLSTNNCQNPTFEYIQYDNKNTSGKSVITYKFRCFGTSNSTIARRKDLWATPTCTIAKDYRVPNQVCSTNNPVDINKDVYYTAYVDYNPPNIDNMNVSVNRQEMKPEDNIDVSWSNIYGGSKGLAYFRFNYERRRNGNYSGRYFIKRENFRDWQGTTTVSENIAQDKLHLRPGDLVRFDVNPYGYDRNGNEFEIGWKFQSSPAEWVKVVKNGIVYCKDENGNNIECTGCYCKDENGINRSIRYIHVKDENGNNHTIDMYTDRY